MARKRFVTSEISTDRKIAKLAEKNSLERPFEICAANCLKRRDNQTRD